MMMSRGDIEHYESLLVLTVAQTLVPKDADWE